MGYQTRRSHYLHRKIKLPVVTLQSMRTSEETREIVRESYRELQKQLQAGSLKSKD